MNQPLKQILRIGGVVVGLGAAVWAMRDKLLPAPEIPDGPPPRFRTGDGAEPNSDGLTSINGVGPVYADRLQKAGIASLADLAAAGIDEISEAAGVSNSTATAWMEQAAALS
ncbi:MAG: helix-hairpin-helix domain-containing protein [Actinomycetota bacterium]